MNENEPSDPQRRTLLHELAVGLSLAPLAALAARPTGAAEPPLLREDEPAAKAQDYVADVRRAHGAQQGEQCSNCSVYGGAEGAVSGTCSVFPGKLVQAAGWCKAWSGL